MICISVQGSHHWRVIRNKQQGKKNKTENAEKSLHSKKTEDGHISELNYCQLLKTSNRKHPDWKLKKLIWLMHGQEHEVSVGAPTTSLVPI